MKNLPWFVALALLAVAPCAAQPQSMTSSSLTQGVGAHGYDFLIGTWSCVNSMPPTPMSGPTNTTLTFSRSGQGTSLFVRVTGKNFDAASYIAYTAKTKTWWNPAALADGSYSDESTSATGKSVVWSGPYFDAGSGKTTQIRDTYARVTANKYTDLGEIQSGGAWKAIYKSTCTKSS
jgi:hypothetical protein